MPMWFERQCSLNFLGSSKEKIVRSDFQKSLEGDREQMGRKYGKLP